MTASDAEVLQARVAGALLGRGLHQGDRVAFVCPNSVDLLCGILGAARVGIVPVPMNPALLDEERAVILDDAEPALVVGPAELETLVEGPTADIAPVPLVRPMHYTSGTTGRPKGVWSGVLDEPDAVALQQDEADVWEFAADDVLLVCSPLYHSAPLRFSTGTLLAGGDVVVLERFDVGAVVHAIADERPTLSFVVPAYLQRLFARGDLPDLSSFRRLVHAGAPCPRPIKEAALDAFPSGTVWEFYGSTEGQFTACPPEDWLAHPGTVGRARPGRRLEVDSDGLIWCHVPTFARFEYWRDPERTRQAWRDDAFTAGDLGHLDDGFLFIDSRRDDLIISGGVNVYPAEVENVLSTLTGVDDVAVFGVPDDRWGQRVCAAVVGDVRPEMVVDHARAHLAAYKCPKDVYLVDDLPRTGTGKVRRSRLAAELFQDVDGAGDHEQHQQHGNA
ncbi:MAG: AMP-binding protein [Acidimicrobiia bacterium]|nr:AMP-binding protein [Acidimicrobiia bacterium]